MRREEWTVLLLAGLLAGALGWARWQVEGRAGGAVGRGRDLAAAYRLASAGEVVQ